MNVRTYRADSMREALEVVRRELGSDAIILSAQQTPVRRRFPWQKRRETAEIVAGVAEQAAPLRDTASRPPRRKAADDAAARTPRVVAPITDPDAVRTSTGDEALEELIQQLNRHSTTRVRTEIPDDLFHLYTRLIDADVHEQDARELVLELPRGLRRNGSPEQVANDLAALIERTLHCCGPIRITPGVRTVAALVGPTGVGKTTTLAKLAANFKLRDGANVGLVTVDTYRVAAVEQLRTYAELIDLPMHVVSNPREMRQALAELKDVDLVLIDTAGRSPRDEIKIQELKSVLAEADVDQVHLVLSLVSGARSLEQAAQKFRSVGTTSLLLTKLDEAAGAGAVLSAARRVGLPISYLTTGQDVPDDIEAASTPHLSRLVSEALEAGLSTA